MAYDARSNKGLKSSAPANLNAPVAQPTEQLPVKLKPSPERYGQNNMIIYPLYIVMEKIKTLK